MANFSVNIVEALPALPPGLCLSETPRISRRPCLSLQGLPEAGVGWGGWSPGCLSLRSYAPPSLGLLQFCS